MLRHLACTRWRLHKLFPRAALDRIHQAIAASRAAHRGQICFAVESALHGAAYRHGQSPHDRAVDVFAQLRVWDTEHNNGVLIYVLIADRAVEIVADRGISAHVGQEAWADICHAMEAAFSCGCFLDGSLQGISAVSDYLICHFPAKTSGSSALPDNPVVLD